MSDATNQINPDARDRIDRNARAALAVLGADTQRAFQRADESVEAFVPRMAYNIAYAMEEQRDLRLESGQAVETVGPVGGCDLREPLSAALSDLEGVRAANRTLAASLVGEEPPHNDNLPRLPLVLSEEQIDSACDWMRESHPVYSGVSKSLLLDDCLRWHQAMLALLSKPEPAEPAKPTSQGMAFPVRVSGCPPHDGLLFSDVGSIEFLGRIASSYQLKEIGFFVRDDNNVDWVPDGDDGYKRKDA